MGKGNCYFSEKEIDHEAKEYCFCYQKHHMHKEHNVRMEQRQLDLFLDFDESILDEL